MPHNAHVIDYLDAITSLYTDAAAIGFPVAHIAEFYLDRWWADVDAGRDPTEVIP